jgi:Fe-Mn family superoxide dismutase
VIRQRTAQLPDIGRVGHGNMLKLKNIMLEEKATPFTLPKLPYKYSGLEPHIDAETMKIHHRGHQQTYVDNLNEELRKLGIEFTTLPKIFENIREYNSKVRNNAGGVYNHTFFWNIMSPSGGKLQKNELFDAIAKQFGSFDSFKSDFIKESMSLFGSGWVWLTLSDGKLLIHHTKNQDNPRMADSKVVGMPILGLDLWEHAYYLKHKNKKSNYINSFFKVINWEYANQLYKIGSEN